MSRSRVSALFLDIGGVLLTNGWDRRARAAACREFGLDEEETTERHNLTFDTYEVGKLSLRGYLGRVVFHRERPFTPERFEEFMFAQSREYPAMTGLVRGLKARWGLKIATLSNEGKELTEFRIGRFGLREYVDFFIASSFVHIRKPDEDIFRLALDVAQVPAEEVVYIEDRLMFVEVARSLGLRAVQHVSVEQTRRALAELGLPAPGQDVEAVESR